MSKHFTNLHVHTDYSLLDGAISLERLISFGQEHQFKSLAISDHGNVFGAVKFFQLCKKANIKPVLGMEAYLTPDAQIKDAENKYYHLMLIVQNSIGYRNLCKLIAFSYQEGFYFKPRIDYRMLEKHSEGLIVTTACLGGHIPKLVMGNQMAAAHERVDWFLSTFGPDRFFLEVQPESQDEQKQLNSKLYQLATERSLKLVATGDSHYATPEDHEAHEVMLSIQTHDKIDNPDRYTFGECRVPLRTQNEMLSLFSEHEDAVWNSGFIADQCDFKFETDKLFFPKFAIPAQHTQESYFKEISEHGLRILHEKGFLQPDLITEYEKRLALEIDLIIKMGFVGYFLVVSDFIQWSRRNGIPVGPGRGSAAGSLVAWALEITNIDPLKYNLLFERFLNPERVSMPDIDIDFCIEGRDRVIQYVRNKYGHENVCHIITFGTMLAKAAIKDVARVLGFPFEDANAISNLIPEQLKITLNEALEQEPRLHDLIKSNAKAKKLFDLALRLEGLTRHASKHAAGIVISPEPISDVLPVYVPAKSTELVAQYAMTELESIGFLKIDLLGLKNLTLIDRAVALIRKNYDANFDINTIPLDDQKTFALISEGNTSGVFQLESSGLKDVLRKLQPSTFEDIIAVNALYRPGPLGSGMVDDFIERRHGRQRIIYNFPELESVLKETYGVIVYQEQVMKIASVIAGYTLGQADILRRAMGKKKAEEMAKQRETFVAGAQQHNFDVVKAGELFDLMAYFAGYGFNKSHSAAYALIAYHTAYLKANYPSEFMACLISLEATHAEKMSFYLQEAKDMGIAIQPPNINTSLIDFSVHDCAILFGLHGIKNVGLIAIENIIKERTEKGNFIDLYDFCKRVDMRMANKRVIESLIYAGAFDTLSGSRAQQCNELAAIMDKALAYKTDQATGQMGLFTTAKSASQKDEPHGFAPCADWGNQEKLEKEKEVIGFYLSAHPLETYRQQLKWFDLPSFATISERALNHRGEQEFIAIACGLLKQRKEIFTKKGDRMAFIQLEDRESSAEIILFPKTFAQCEQWLDTYQVFIVKGAVDATNPRGLKIKANSFIPIELILQEWEPINHVTFTLANTCDESGVQTLSQKIMPGSIPASCVFYENGKKLRLALKQKVALDPAFIAEAEMQCDEIKITL